MKIFINKKINIKEQKNLHTSKGALLLELLIVIALMAIIFTVGTQAVLVSLRSGRNSGERDTAYGLANEGVEIVRGVADQNWQSVYAPAGIVKGTTHYYPLKVSNAWTLAQGDETVIVNGITFTRSIIIDNVSRDATADRKIESTYVSADDNPDTQKITVSVSWTGGDTVTVSSFVFRWRNKVCSQIAWTTQTTPTDSVASCPPTTYFSADSGIDTSVAGTLKLTGTTPKANTGTLISSVFDSTVTGGAGYNSIMWIGALGGVGANEGKVRFQIAASNCASGATDYPTCSTGSWSYYGGATCGAGDYFDAGATNTSSELKGVNCLAAWNNMRYYRYKVQICSNNCSIAGNNSPTVNAIILNWTP